MTRQAHHIFIVIFIFISIVACETTSKQEKEDQEAVQKQQAQYAKGQPIPVYDWSLERGLVIELYNVRNQKVATHAVWRSDTGIVEGDCPSMGFGVPYDTSLTNPLQPAYSINSAGTVAVGQAEPNGIFASTNTAATWVMCVDETGALLPTYVESKVTVYPHPVLVDYDSNRVTRGEGKAFTIEVGK